MEVLKSVDNVADIFYDGTSYNPTIMAPNAPYDIQYALTLEVAQSDPAEFKAVIDSAIYQFRHSRVYNNYKKFLYDIGMDRCQVLGNITNDMADLEMHHNGITIFDIAVMIAYHLMLTTGKVTSFDIIRELRYAHTNHKVGLVMLCKTAHQLYHNNSDFIVPASMTFGYWTELLNDYKYGINYGIAKKIYMFIEESIRHTNDNNLNDQLLSIRNTIKGWSDYNECAYNNNGYNSISSNNFSNIGVAAGLPYEVIDAGAERQQFSSDNGTYFPIID